MIQVIVLAATGCVLLAGSIAGRTLFRWVRVYYRHT